MIARPREPLTWTTTMFGKIAEVRETDEYVNTPLQAMLTAQKYASGVMAMHPRSDWVEGQSDPWTDLEDSEDLT